MRCQRSGTAWQNAWTRPSGSIERPVGGGEDDARRPERERDDPRIHGPDADRRWPPGHRRRPPPASRPPARWPAAAAALTTPVTSGPSAVRGSHDGSISSASTTSADQSRAARSNSSVPAPSARSTAWSPVSRWRTKSFGSRTWAIRRQTSGSWFRTQTQLRRGEAGERVVAGDLDEPPRPDPCDGSRRTRPPCAGRSTGLPDAAAGRHRRAGPRRASGPRARRRRRPRRRCRRRPAPRGSRPGRRSTTAAGPARSRAAAGPRSRTRRSRSPATRPVLVDEERLGGGGRDVDSEDVGCHALSGPDRPTRSSG